MEFPETIKNNIIKLIGIPSKIAIKEEVYSKTNIGLINAPASFREFMFSLGKSYPHLKDGNRMIVCEDSADVNYIDITLKKYIPGIINMRIDYEEEEKIIHHQIGKINENTIQDYINTIFEDGFCITKIEFIHRLKIQNHNSIGCRKCTLLGNTFWIDYTVDDLRKYTITNNSMTSIPINGNTGIPYCHWDLTDNISSRCTFRYNDINKIDINLRQLRRIHENTRANHNAAIRDFIRTLPIDSVRTSTRL